MMPTEGFTLGNNREGIIGQPIAAGMFIILSALQVGIQNIGLVTYGNHHNVPKLAALDYLKSFASQSAVIIIETHPKFIHGGKDWASVMRSFNQSTYDL